MWLICEHCRKRRADTSIGEGQYMVLKHYKTGWTGLVCQECGEKVLERLGEHFVMAAKMKAEVLEYVSAQLMTRGMALAAREERRRVLRQVRHEEVEGSELI